MQLPTISVLEEQGFVRLVDLMGNDMSVVNSARISYDGESKGEKQDKRLINYLYRNRHTSPFEHVSFTFHVKAPIFIARQWMRHRTWKFNEVSARYTVLPDEFYTPPHWRGQSKSNKQMSDGTISDDVAACIDEQYQELTSQARNLYEGMISRGVARELARMVLPVSVFTEFYATVDLHNLLHFINLRLHPHAQVEIQEYAQAMLDLVRWSGNVPWTLEAWEKYQLEMKEARVSRKLGEEVDS